MPIEVTFGNEKKTAAPKSSKYSSAATNFHVPDKKADPVVEPDGASHGVNHGRMYNYTSKNEGFKSKVYLDTEKIPTVGSGLNLTVPGTKERINKLGGDYDAIMAGTAELDPAIDRTLMEENLQTAVDDARALAPSFDQLSEARQTALTDMAYNLGRERMAGFKDMLAAVEAEDWTTAAKEIGNSTYAKQVKGRADKNMALMQNQGFLDDGISTITAQPIPKPEPPRNKYKDAAAAWNEDDATVAKGLRKQMAAEDPDKAAEANALSQLTGIPAKVVALDPDKAKQQARQQVQDAALDASPVTAKSMTDPEFAKVAHKDIGALAEVEHVIDQELKPERRGTVGNLAAGIGERFFSGIVGGTTSFVGSIADDTADWLEKGLPLGRISYNFTGDKANGPLVGWRASTEEDLLKPSPLERFADDFRATDLNYQPGTEWQDVKDHPLTNFLPFALEQGIVSVPDMVAVLVNMPRYVAARIGEIGTTRADNDGRTEATIGDFMASAPAAVASAMLERLGTKGILGLGAKPVGAGVVGIAAASGKAGAKELGTEALQEGAESVAETLGTKKGFSAAETADRMAAGAVGGFGFGATLRSGTATIEQLAASTAAQDHKTSMDRIQQVIDRNPMTKRDPAKAAEHVAASTPATTEHFVTIKAIDDMAEEAGVPVGEIYARLGIVDQVEEAHLTGGDVLIDPATFAQYVYMDPEVYNALADHVRANPEAMTSAEAAEFDTGIVEEQANEAEEVRVEQEAQIAVDEGLTMVDTPDGPIADRRATSRESVAAGQSTFRAEAARAAGDDVVASRWAKIGQLVEGGDKELETLVEKYADAEGTDLLKIEDEIEEIVTADQAVQDAQERVLEAAAPTNPDLEPASADVSLARVELGLYNLFRTADEAGMTPRQYESYLVAVAEAAQDSKNRQENDLLKLRAKVNKEQIADERVLVEEQMRESVQNQPVYAAMNSIGQDRMSRDAVIDMMPDGEAQLDQLPKIKGVALHTNKREKGGVHPGAIAEAYGFPDGQTMLFSMIDAVPEADVIQAATDQEMLARHPELFQEKQMIEEAIKNLHTDKQGAILAMEMNALREARGAGRMSRQLIASEARRRMGDKVIKDVRVDKLLAAEKREGLTAGKLLRKGDRTGASQAKFRQLMNYEMAKHAMKVRENVKRQKKYMEDFLKVGRKFPTVDADYIDSIFQMLGQYDLGPKAREPKDMVEWRDKEMAAGQQLGLPTHVWAGARNYVDMTIDEFDALYDGIKNIEAQGKLKKGLTTAGEGVLFEDRKELLLEAADKLQDTGRVKRARESLARSWKDVQLSRIAHMDAGIRRVEFLMKTLDNFKVGGWWQKTVFQPFADSQALNSDMMKEIGQPIIKALNSLPKEVKKALGKTIDVPSLNRKMTRGQLVMVALNTGNEGNLQKMVRGSAMDNGAPAWTEEGVAKAMSLLSEEEADFVQLVWNAYAKLRPEVERIYRAENGRSPGLVTPRAVEIGGKIVEGGYFPMMYRRDTATVVPENAMDAMNAPHVKEGVYSGFNIERTGYAAPVVLDLNALPHGLQQQLHYISHYEAVRDVNRMIRDPQIKSAIQSKLGDEYYENIDEWVKALATSGANQHKTKAWDDMFTFFRGNVTAAVMVASWTTGVAQTFGLSTSVAVLGQMEGGKTSSVEGTKWMAIGLNTYKNNPVASTKMIKRLSGEMRHRLSNTDRDMGEALQAINISTEKGKMRSMIEWQQRVGFLAIGGIQMYSVDVPTWLGGFNQALSQGKSEQEAANHADSVVRLSQATGAMKDLSTLQRRRDIWRAVTMFSTYSITLYNLQAETAGAAKRNPRDIGSVVARLMWLVALPAMADALLRQEFPDDDDKQDPVTWAMLKTLGYSLGSIPVIGRGLESGIQGFTPTVTPVETLPRNIISALEKMGDAWEDGELNSETARAIWLAAGNTLGIGGTYQINRIWKAIEAEDDAELYDFFIGYTDR